MGFFEKTRELTTAERDLGWDVFWDTVPFKNVLIGDHLGLGDCPWTQCIDKPGWFTGETYILHMGEIAFKDCTSTAKMVHDNDEVRNTFIHELTHVWQGHHRFLKTVFVESLGARLCAELTGEDAYEYQWGLEWDSYNVEQQAKIIECWFSEGRSDKHKLYEYVKNHIRNT